MRSYGDTSSKLRWAVVFISFFIAGLAYLFYHFVYMPFLPHIWVWYASFIMFVPWIVYGVHELVFWLAARSKGLSYTYTLSLTYLLIVMAFVLYGALSLTLYQLFGIDLRTLLPIIFLPALAVRITRPVSDEIEAEVHLAALLTTFCLTMVFVLWFESLGGVKTAFVEKPLVHEFTMIHGIFGVALYGLFVCLTESLPLKIDGFAFDGYEIFQSKNIALIAIDVLVLFVCLYSLIFRGYLEWFMTPI